LILFFSRPIIYIQAAATAEYIKRENFMHNIDTEKLEKAVRDYKFKSRPSSSNSSDCCTVNDLRNVIACTAELFEKFITELKS